MDEEKRAVKRLFAGEKKPSMKRRDDYNDYADRRVYMITMEVEGRRPLFGRVEGDGLAPEGSSEGARMVLSPLGQAVEAEWRGIPRYYPQIEVLAVQMMPDHLHGILFVHERLPRHLSHVITGFKTGCNRLLKSLLPAATEPQPTANRPTQPAPGQAPLAPYPQAPAACGSRQAAAPSQQGTPHQVVRLFAPGYNDLLLKSPGELENWLHYLRDNPRRLLLKRQRPEWLRPFFGLRIGAQTYSGIGNLQLLASQRRMAVRVSRRLSGQQLDDEVARYLTAAKSGTVLISPAISPGEKRVMRAAFDSSLPTIVIMENGFTPLSKPKGEQFDACAQGRLLMLAPWEHHNERQRLTAMQCQQMNLMAIELAALPPKEALRPAAGPPQPQRQKK